ncbi:hypothetical protein [Glutamicibacter sp. NPDC087344]|uniref:hypothetical protein n=1 Tax=Glutamicibacter sp. NPDC087344 TaxID=3363994 RepID=UPI00381386FA
MDWNIPNRLVDQRVKETLMREAQRELRDEICMRDKEHCRSCGNEVVVDAGPRERRSPAIAALDDSTPPIVENLVLVHRGCLERLREGGVELSAKLLKENRGLAARNGSPVGHGGVWIKVPANVVTVLSFHRLVIEEEIDGKRVPSSGFNSESYISKLTSRVKNGPGNELMPMDLDKKFRQAREFQRELAKAESGLPLLPAELEDRLTYSEQAEYVKAVSEAVAESDFVSDIIWPANQQEAKKPSGEAAKQVPCTGYEISHAPVGDGGYGELLSRIDLTLREIAKDQRVIKRIAENQHTGLGDSLVSQEEPYPVGSSQVSWSISQVPGWEGDNDFSVSRVITRFEGLGVLNSNGYARCYEQFVVACRALNIDPLGFARFKDVLDLLADGKGFLVLTEHDLHRAIKELRSHKTSFSVDGASRDAGVGTSESTEKG